MLKEAKLIRIGNSRGVRLPRNMISKYGLGDRLALEEVEDGILIRGLHKGKLSWEDTAKAMANEAQDEWSNWRDVDVELDDHL